MANFFDQFDTKDPGPGAPNYFDQFDTKPGEEQRSPGYLEQAGRALRHGVEVTLPKAIGDTAQTIGRETGWEGIGKVGEDISQSAELRESSKNTALGFDPKANWDLKRAIYQGFDNLVLSAGPMAVGAAVFSVVPGVGTAMGALIGAGFSILAAGGQQAQESYTTVKEERLKAGDAPDVAEQKALSASRAEGGIEALGELAGDAIFFGVGKVFKPFVSVIAKPGAAAAGHTVKDMMFPGLKEAGKDLLKIEAGEITTEMAQAAGEAEARKAFGGVGEGATWHDTGSVILPTVVMSGVMGLAGTGSRYSKAVAMRNALADQKTDAETRSVIAGGMVKALAEEHPALAADFAAVTAARIRSAQPIDVKMSDEQITREAAKLREGVSNEVKALPAPGQVAIPGQAPESANMQAIQGQPAEEQAAAAMQENEQRWAARSAEEARLAGLQPQEPQIAGALPSPAQVAVPAESPATPNLEAIAAEPARAAAEANAARVEQGRAAEEQRQAVLTASKVPLDPNDIAGSIARIAAAPLTPVGVSGHISPLRGPNAAAHADVAGQVARLNLQAGELERRAKVTGPKNRGAMIELARGMREQAATLLAQHEQTYGPEVGRATRVLAGQVSANVGQQFAQLTPEQRLAGVQFPAQFTSPEQAAKPEQKGKAPKMDEAQQAEAARAAPAPQSVLAAQREEEQRAAQQPAATPEEITITAPAETGTIEQVKAAVPKASATPQFAEGVVVSPTGELPDAAEKASSPWYHSVAGSQTPSAPKGAVTTLRKANLADVWEYSDRITRDPPALNVMQLGHRPVPQRYHEVLASIMHTALLRGASMQALSSIHSFYVYESGGEATWTHHGGVTTIGFRKSFLDAVIAREGGWDKYAAGVLVHELTHELDNDAGASVSTSATLPGSPYLVTTVKGKRTPTGRIINESLNNHNLELWSHLKYPMLYWQQRHVPDTTIAEELFAQHAALYLTNPKLMAQELPLAYALHKEIEDGLTQLHAGDIQGARKVVRSALQATGASAVQGPVVSAKAGQRTATSKGIGRAAEGLGERGGERQAGVDRAEVLGRGDGRDVAGRVAEQGARQHEAPVAGRVSLKESKASAARYEKLAIGYRESDAKPLGQKGVNVEDVGRHFEREVIAHFGEKLDWNNPDHLKRAIKQAIREFRYQLQQVRSGLGWYSTDIREAMEITSRVIPELKDNPTNQKLFTIVAALLSPANPAAQNWEQAGMVMQGFFANGRFPLINPISGKGWGVRTNVNQQSLSHLQAMVDDMGVEATVDYLFAPHTVRDLRKMKAKYGFYLGVLDKRKDAAPGSRTDMAAMKGGLDEIRTGVFLFGQKVGPFALNLNGFDTEVTVDLWMTRTFLRYFGQNIGMVKDEETGKVREGMIDAPTEPMRRKIVELVHAVAKETGYKPNDIQAVLWFFEQQLYTQLGAASESAFFSDGARELERSGGIRNAGAGNARGNLGFISAAEEGPGTPPAGAAVYDDFREDPESALKKPGWFIITGTQEALGPATNSANEANNVALKNELDHAGFENYPVKGSYEGVDQGKNFLVFGTEADALRLGRKYQQESVLTNRGYIYQNGAVRPVIGDAIVGAAARQESGYSVLPDGTAFSMQLDWENDPIPAGQVATKAIAQPAERVPLWQSALENLIPTYPWGKSESTSPKQLWAWINSRMGEGKVKKAEIETIGLENWLNLVGDKVTKEQVENFVHVGGPQIDEVMLGDLEASEGRILSGAPRYESWKLQGGDQYTELLITLPVSEDRAPTGGFIVRTTDTTAWGRTQAEARANAGVFLSAHFEQPNIVAHARVDERTDDSGDRVLFVEELQSDWAQSGRKRGFINTEAPEPLTELPVDAKVKQYTAYVYESHVGAKQTKWAAVWGDMSYTGKTKEEASGRLLNEINQRRHDAWRRKASYTVPHGPFVEKTEQWVALALKRLIRYAVDRGIKKIAWTTGAQQDARYDLGEAVDRVDVQPKDGGFNLAAYRGGELILHHQATTEQDLSDYIGKSLTQQALAQIKEKGTAVIEGGDLRIGGEGMAGFYEGILPNVANDVLKKLGGGRVETLKLGDPQEGEFPLKKEPSPERGRALIFRDRNGVREYLRPLPERVGDIASWVQSRASAASYPNDVVDGVMDTLRQQNGSLKRAGLQPGFVITDKMMPAAAGPQFKFSRSGGISFDGTTPEQEQALRNVGAIVDPTTWKQYWDGMTHDLKARMIQGVADQFHSLKRLDPRAYLLARLSKGADGAFEAWFNWGNLRLLDGVTTSTARDGGIVDILKKLEGEHHKFFWWVAAQRAERLTREERENLFERGDIEQLKRLNEGNLKSGRSRAEAFDQALREWNAANDQILDVAVQSGILTPELRASFRDQPYVPFYRVFEDEAAGKYKATSPGLARQYAFKKLKGGERKLNQDLLANALKNVAHLIDASAKNRAAIAAVDAAVEQGLATEIPEALAGKHSTWFLRNGQKVHVEFDETAVDVLASMSSLNAGAIAGKAGRVLSTFKNVLTMGVTVNPAFKMRNLIRDSIQAIATSSELSANPLRNVKEGIGHMRAKDQVYAQALASGALIRFGTMLEGNRAKHADKLIKSGIADQTILDTPEKIADFAQKAWDKYNEIGDISEGANRIALFQQALDGGRSLGEAALLARDLMDFSMGGASPAIRFLTQTVPFMNARIQGLYRLGRATTEDTARFAMTTAAVALASVALLAAYHDDDDWKARPDYDRDNYWWFKVGGTAFRLPKPFEVGAIGTLAERGVELFTNDDFTRKMFLQRIGFALHNTFAFNPIPQMVKPITDVYSNYDSFRGTPIETAGMERLPKQFRSARDTSLLARGIGYVTGNLGVASPVEVDHLIRGYLGWLGTMTIATSEAALHPLLSDAAAPEKRLHDIFFVGNFIDSLPAGSSKYVSRFYEQATEINQAYEEYRDRLKKGDIKGAQEYLVSHQNQIARESMMRNASTMLSKIRAQEQRIYSDTTMSPAAKRDAIDQLDLLRNRFAERIARANTLAGL